ncbi:hypothetical protein BKA58DRAFT_397687 [Alternaria rosae]|uniref:uncharacterized protein n=1 Tax=Alternaria rosae TaxID=1187941 RepID=UPI001E8DA2BA|nr:uncharacterized protein BKA58DRAFT_397687 [Alternaria rosae]KAH6877531.1 hypothetical protein BKA58DRAFT_397687 [Alternaria rosae]
MQGFLSRLCARRYAADKTILDRMNATLLLCKVRLAAPVVSVSDCQQHLKLPADSSLVRQMQLVLCRWGARTVQQCSYTSRRPYRGLHIGAWVQSVHRYQSANTACCSNTSSRCTDMQANFRANDSAQASKATCHSSSSSSSSTMTRHMLPTRHMLRIRNVSIPSPLLANVNCVQDDFVRPANITDFLCGCITPFNISSLILVQNLQTPTHAAIQGPRQDAGTGLN